MDRGLLAGCCAASAVSLIAGLFYVPNVARVKTLDCIEGETCHPTVTLGTLWSDLPLPLAYVTLGALCWVILVNLATVGLLAFTRIDVPRWLRLSYLIGGLCLAAILSCDALYLVWGRRPGPGVLLVLAGLCLLGFVSLRTRLASSGGGA